MKASSEQVLSLLEKRLRLLPGKRDYIRYFDECATSQSSVFDRQRLAFSLYKDIHGKIYTQPEFASQATLKDVIAQHRYRIIFKGISAYFDASAERQAAFKKRVLSRPNIFSRMMSGIFYFQNTKV